MVIIIIGTASRSSLTLKSNCICPGYSVTFAECTVKGRFGEHTVWKGSAFDCIGNEIALIHGTGQVGFNTTIAAGECNNKSIRAQIIRIEGNCYTSQININVDDDIIGKTIICVHDNVTETVVGTLTLAFAGNIIAIIL